MEIFLNDMFYVASLSQFTISLTLQSACILNGAKWVGHPPGKSFYDYFHDFVIFMHVFNRMQLALKEGSVGIIV